MILRSLAAEHGYSVPELARLTERASCSGCGLNKRYEFNRSALEEGFEVLVTGHNLDDEVATLLGNVLHWNLEQLERGGPVLEERIFGEGSGARTALVRKVKPLVRLTERETAAYALLMDIDYIIEECPMVEGNTQQRYKEAMTKIEESSPGTKQQFLFGFYKKGATLFANPLEGGEVVACASCGAPTVRWGDEEARCSFCKMKALALSRKQAGYVPDGKSRRRGRRPHPPARAAEGSPVPR